MKGNAKVKPPKKPKPGERKPLSLHPLNFDEAVSDILKVKPEPRSAKKKPARQQKPASGSDKVVH